MVFDLFLKTSKVLAIGNRKADNSFVCLNERATVEFLRDTI